MSKKLKKDRKTLTLNLGLRYTGGDHRKLAVRLRQMADEYEQEDRLVKAMGIRRRMLSTPGDVVVSWRWPGARVAKTFREELAAARLVRRTMGRAAAGYDVRYRRARGAERSTGPWVPTYRWVFAAKTRSALDDLTRRAQQLTGVTVWVLWRPARKPSERFREYRW